MKNWSQRCTNKNLKINLNPYPPKTISIYLKSVTTGKLTIFAIILAFPN